MFPSIVARQVHESVGEFLREQFRTTERFFLDETQRSIVERYVDSPSNVHKGPWLEVKLPFRSAESAEVPALKNLRMQYAPYLHQLQAFERLSSFVEEPKSTIIATGTGSGKTECFAYPVYDHCIEAQKRHTPGIKAIIIYPMNALATDQARRFARDIHAQQSGLRVGLYIGKSKSQKGPTESVNYMSETEVITDRATLQDNPPDILLTNYKMLDYLLMRPEDQKIWRHNHPGTLRYLIVDELHTFDGAQGTDLACLIRRLRARISAGDELICVGTSATIGSGEQSKEDLRNYASQVFATPMDEDSIIGETRLNLDEYLAKYAEKPPAPNEGSDGTPNNTQTSRTPQHLQNVTFQNVPLREVSEILRQRWSKHELMEALADVWFQSASDNTEAQTHVPRLRFPEDDPDACNAARIELGHRLRKHDAFIKLLDQCTHIRDVRELANEWLEVYSYGEIVPTLEDALHALDSFVSLIAWARDEAPAPLAQHNADTAEEGRVEIEEPDVKKPLRTQPMLHVRAQLWLRELRRMVSSISNQPEIYHDDDITERDKQLYLPLVHCRECLAMGWGSVWSERAEPVSRDLRQFYMRWFEDSTDVQLFYPLAEGDDAPTDKQGSERYLCTGCAQVHMNATDRCCGTEESPVDKVRVWIPTMGKRENGGRVFFDNRCPHCHERSSLIIIGSRAASIASVMIAQLFGSAYVDDRKLITFSDSVQDAAHRAGFFGARTYHSVSRIAMQTVAEAEGDGSDLNTFCQRVASYWREKLTDAEFVGTFIAPNMEWLSDYQALRKDEALPPHSQLPDWVARRLAWDTLIELGFRARIGRSLEKKGTATIAFDEATLQRVANDVGDRLREHIEPLRNVSTTELTRFLRGLLTDWKHRGAFDVEEMRTFVNLQTNTFRWSMAGSGGYFYLPNYGHSVPPPTPLTFEENRHLRFSTPLTSHAHNSTLWSSEWYRRTLLGSDNAERMLADGTHHGVMRTIVEAMLRHNVLIAADKHATPNTFLMNPSLWRVHTHSREMRCSQCERLQVVPEKDVKIWEDMQCLRATCQGVYRFHAQEQRDHHTTPTRENAHAETQALSPTRPQQITPTRVVASEHTGLLESDERKAIEEAFIHSTHTWDVNLLSSTPTLEMGIDIGDLSSVLLCSVPPTQANYLQRIGRAGRRDGNALTMVIANAKAHDNYFFADPMEMMDGTIHTPGVFLKALAVLERQLIAYSFDRWAQTNPGDNAIPPKLKSVLDAVHAERKDKFPYPVLDYIYTHREELLEEFFQYFDGLGDEGEAHLSAFLKGDRSEKQSLRTRVLSRLKSTLDARTYFSERLAKARKEKRRWEKAPDDEEKQNHLAALDQEIETLVGLRKSIDDRETLNFFTDEGLLPNYAFPEEGVTLESVIVQPQNRGPNGEKAKPRYQTRTFQRSASASLKELAPDSNFYAAAHQLTIERIDLKLNPVEVWRLCDNCHHAERVNERTQELPQCPECHSEMWADVGQKQELVRLRHVHAYAHGQKDRIDDGQEHRHTTFYEQQFLVDIPRSAQRIAWKIDDENYPFGFEFLPRVQFRELNFGELGGQGENGPKRVAGKEAHRPGFRICKHCGVVKPKRANEHPRHAFDCNIAQDPSLESEDAYFKGLYLYRELQSESIRILLPIAEAIGSDLSKASFIAALQLGLRKHFKGDVQHLEITQMREDQGAGNSPRDYVLIYDKVPGGTGYLKDLMRDPQNLFGAFEAGLKALQNCPTCSLEEDRDGCYQCLLAYRSAHAHHSISRTVAIRLFKELTEYKDKLVQTSKLEDIPLSAWHESRFESKFVEELKKVPGLDVVLNEDDTAKTYHIYHQDLRWDLVAQQEVRDPHTDQLITRSDFFLRLVKAPTPKDQPKTDLTRFDSHIYLDGWEFHRASTADDVRKRNHILSTDQRVWTFTWEDLPDGAYTNGRSNLSLLRTRTPLDAPQTKQPTFVDFVRKQKWVTKTDLIDTTSFVQRGTFDWLVAWIKDPFETERALRQAARLEIFARVPASKEAPDENVLKSALSPRTFEYTQEAGAKRFYGGALTQDPDDPGRFGPASILVSLNAISLTSSDANWYDDAIATLFIDEESLIEHDTHRKSWRAFWTAANLLQFAPHFAFTTQANLDDLRADETWPDWPIKERRGRSALEHFLSAKQDPDDQDEWAEMITAAGETIFVEENELRKLYDAKLPVPTAGHEIFHNQRVLHTAELCWEDAKIAVFLDEDAEQTAETAPTLLANGWTILSTDQNDWTDRVIDALTQGNNP